jgi:hypothetical protein
VSEVGGAELYCELPRAASRVIQTAEQVVYNAVFIGRMGEGHGTTVAVKGQAPSEGPRVSAYPVSGATGAGQLMVNTLEHGTRG